MDLNEYQQAALRTASFELPREIALAVAGLGVAGEAGEVADHVKKYLGHGHPLDVEKLRLELGDVLWYLAYAARLLGLTLDEVAQTNLDKLAKRYPDGFSTEASLYRAKEE